MPVVTLSHAQPTTAPAASPTQPNKALNPPIAQSNISGHHPLVASSTPLRAGRRRRSVPPTSMPESGRRSVVHESIRHSSRSHSSDIVTVRHTCRGAPCPGTATINTDHTSTVAVDSFASTRRDVSGSSRHNTSCAVTPTNPIVGGHLRELRRRSGREFWRKPNSGELLDEVASSNKARRGHVARRGDCLKRGDLRIGSASLRWLWVGSTAQAPERQAIPRPLVTRRLLQRRRRQRPRSRRR